MAWIYPGPVNGRATPCVAALRRNSWLPASGRHYLVSIGRCAKRKPANWRAFCLLTTS